MSPPAAFLSIISERIKMPETISTTHARTPSSPSRLGHYFLLAALCAASFVFGLAGTVAQSSTAVPAQIHYDEAAHTFRMDAADVSYVFGVNQNGELQTLYWGKRLRPADPFPEARADEGSSGFDLPVNATPQEFTGWGGGLVVVPDLKITFPDGNRDLVLHYVSHAIRDNVLTITLKDISRDVFVDLQYEIDAETGILARSARVENRTHEPFTIEQAFAATWNLPASQRISTSISHRPLGRGVEFAADSAASGQSRAREPARFHRRRGQPVVRHRARQPARSGRGRRMVRRAGMEWFMANQHRDRLGKPGSDHWRIHSV